MLKANKKGTRKTSLTSFIVNFEHFLHFFKCFYCWLWTYKSSLGWYSAYHLENFKDIIPCWNSNSSSLLKSIQSLSSGRGVPVDAWKENKLCLFPILNKFRLMYWPKSIITHFHLARNLNEETIFHFIIFKCTKKYSRLLSKLACHLKFLKKN